DSSGPGRRPAATRVDPRTTRPLSRGPRGRTLTESRARPGGVGMIPNRRHFLHSATAAGLVAAAARRGVAEGERPPLDQLTRAAAGPVLNLDGLKTPVRIASLELLRNGRTYLVRARSTDGGEGLIVPNADRLRDVYPVFLNRVAPFFKGK